MRTTWEAASTSHTRCRLSLNTIRRPWPDSAGSAASSTSAAVSGRFAPSVTSLVASTRGVVVRSRSAPVSSAGDDARSMDDAGSASSVIDGSSPAPPTTATTVTASEDVSVTIRP